MNIIFKHYHNIVEKFSPLLSIAALFLLRLALACPFWKAGLTKWHYFQNDQLDTLYFIFEDYNVPLLPVEVAAWAGTFAELFLPILLVFGLFTRFAGLGIIGLSAVIYSVDQNPDTFIWAAAAFTLVATGAGKASIDFFFRNCFACNK